MRVRVRARVRARVRVRAGAGVGVGVGVVYVASSTWPKAKISSKKFLMACKEVVGKGV